MKNRNRNELFRTERSTELIVTKMISSEWKLEMETGVQAPRDFEDKIRSKKKKSSSVCLPAVSIIPV